MPRKPFHETDQQPKTLIIGVESPYNTIDYISSYFDEFKSLVKTSGIEYVEFIPVRLRTIDAAFFFTKGKREQIKEICQNQNIERVILSDQLSAQQARNLEDYLDAHVWDRTDLILDIFEKAAVSAEGKAQVAIAMLQHKKSRLAGKGIHMSQQMGAKGFIGGPGEKAKERDRRHIDEQIRKIKKQLATIQKTRSVQRKQRLSKGVRNICLIGYTNAGKSTILNALTNSDVLAEDKLFATLDTTTRALFVDGKQKGVISDTVGFIQNLPHKLIEAFKSTLSELQFADLLLHVIDLSDPNWEDHLKVVHDILEELQVEKDILYIFNKADQVDDLSDILFKIECYQPNVIINALSKKGLQPLTDYLSGWKEEQ